MEDLEPVVAMVGVVIFFAGFGLMAHLSQMHGGRWQKYIIQAYVFGMLAGFALCLVVVFLALSEGVL